MARTELTVQTLSTDGVTPAATAGTADGHFFSNPASSARYGNRLVRVTNGGVAGRDITFQTGGQVEGEEIEEKTITIPAGATRLFGPFSPRVYNQADGTLNVDYHAGNESDLSIEVYEMPVS